MKWIQLSLLTLLLYSCSNVYYVSDPMTGLDASSYNSYATEENCDDEMSMLTMQRIKNAVDLSMRDYGYSRSENPDVLVKYFVKNKTKKYVEECEDHYDRWTGGETCREKVLTYEEGSIVLDIIDTNTNTIIWHGAARGPSFTTLRNPDENINKMIDKLMGMYFSHLMASQ